MTDVCHERAEMCSLCTLVELRIFVLPSTICALPDIYVRF
jgi:hypothetical protein